MTIDRIRQQCRDLGAGAALLAERAEAILRMAARYRAALAGGGTLFFAGNGGSAAHAQHIATEYQVRFRRDRSACRALALGADGVALTAAANDLGFERVFARQIEALARPGDLVVLVSTSGRSANLLAAARTARGLGVSVVALLGGDGGPLAELVDEAVIVPAAEASRIQELQLFIDHTIVELVEEGLES
jgi:D-sedoheptulose 7-phosphate isomerase